MLNYNWNCLYPPFNTLFIECRVLNILFFYRSKDILFLTLSVILPLHSRYQTVAFIIICRLSLRVKVWFFSLIMTWNKKQKILANLFFFFGWLSNNSLIFFTKYDSSSNSKIRYLIEVKLST